MRTPPVHTTLASQWRQRRGLVFFVFSSHWLLLLLCQVEALTYLQQTSPTTGQAYDIELLWLQGPGILAAALMALVVLIPSPRAWQRNSLWLLLTMMNLYVILNQVSVKVFFSHFNFTFLDGTPVSIAPLLGSFLHELDGNFAINLVLVAAISTVIHHQLHGRPLALFTRHSSHSEFLVIVAAALLLAFDLASDDPHVPEVLRTHPVQALWTSLNQAVGHDHLTLGTTDRSAVLRRIAAELPLDEPAAPPESAQVFDHLQHQLAGANLILVVLESVGSMQLLPRHGHPDARITPFLADAFGHSIVFDTLYSVFPATVRSHLAIHTGGLTLTWGSIKRDLTYPYRGPTLARILQQAGYQTGVFSSQSLQFENMDEFYQAAGFETIFEFGRLPEEKQQQYRLSSWGGEEFHTLSQLFAWLDNRDRHRPFFASLLTVASHHPYLAPRGYPGPNKETGNRFQRYQNTLHYIDLVIKTLFSKLADRNLTDRTLVALIGDHGQAFGRYHSQNYTHKHYLYEENVKNFLWLINPAAPSTGMISHRIGSMGDVMPTLLALLGVTPPPATHRNLFLPPPTVQPVYFFKNSFPEKWGLRLGQWKYIENIRGDTTELFRLDRDPHEQNNLADRYPDVLPWFRRLVQSWYLRTNDRFVAQLEGHRYLGGRPLTGEELAHPGPKILAFGYLEHTDDGQRFTELETIHPRETLVAWTKWIPYSHDQPVQFRWLGPNGEQEVSDFLVEKDWTTTHVFYEGTTPLARGTWTLEIRQGEKRLIVKDFRVHPEAPLHRPRQPPTPPESSPRSPDHEHN